MAAFVFDYRHLGSSDGEPRQLLDIGRQLEDLHAAVAHVRARPEERHGSAADARERLRGDRERMRLE